MCVLEEERDRNRRKVETLQINATEFTSPIKSTMILINIYSEALTHRHLRVVETLTTIAKNLV